MRRRHFLAIASAMPLAAAPPNWAERLGVMCNLPKDELGARLILQAAARAGYRAIQVSLPWDQVDEVYLQALPGWVQASSLRCEALGAYVNCAHPETVLMNTRASDIPRAIETAKALNCRRLVAWTGGYGAGLMTPDERNAQPAAQEAILRFVGAHAAAFERANLRLALETYVTLVCPDAPSLARLLVRLPSWAGAVMDPPNLTPIPRYGWRDIEMRAMFELLRERIEIVHLKDFLLKPTGDAYDLPGPLKGELNYPLFAKHIATLPPGVPVIAEHIGPGAFHPTREALLPLLERA